MRHLTYFFAAIGYLAASALLLIGAFAWLLSSDSDTIEHLNATYVSPDGIYVAVHKTFTSGGAAGSCSQSIIVSQSRPKQQSAKDTKVDETVFEATCGTKVSATWENPSTLNIRYGFVNDSLRATIHNKDRTGQVTIHYEIDNQVPQRNHS